jgi:branched-chain amino acid transport system substrate-binding protein
MKPTARALALAIAAAGVALSSTVPVASQTQPPYEINAVISTTGYLAFVGKGEMRSLQVLEDVVNKSGGIKGRPVKFVFSDTQSSPQTALQLVSDIAAKKAVAIVGPDTGGECSAVAPLYEKTGPVLYCLSPALEPAPKGYIFSAQVRPADLIVATIRFFKEHGWTKVALITTNDGNGQFATQAYKATLLMPEFRGMRSVDTEFFAPADLSVTAELAKMKTAAPDAIIALASGTPWGTLARNIRDIGLDDLPVMTFSNNANATVLKQFAAFLPKQLYFPAQLGTVLGDTPNGPARTAQNAFFAAYKERGLAPPDATDSIPWDAASLYVAALRSIGTDATSTQIRDWILAQKSWPGVFGIYNFTDGSQRGIGEMNVLMLRYDPSKPDMLAVASKPGGYK